MVEVDVGGVTSDRVGEGVCVEVGVGGVAPDRVDVGVCVEVAEGTGGLIGGFVGSITGEYVADGEGVALEIGMTLVTEGDGVTPGGWVGDGPGVLVPAMTMIGPGVTLRMTGPQLARLAIRAVEMTATATK